MRKKIAISVLGLLTCLGATAQVHGHREDRDRKDNSAKRSQLAIRYGVKAGVNLSTMSNGMQFDPGFGMGAGFRVGAVANFHWGQRTSTSLPGTGWFGLQPELMYSYQTVKTDGGDIKMNYIQLPVMLKVYPLSALSIEAGPEFNYLISTSPDRISAGGAVVKTSDMKGFNIGLGAGVAYELRMGLMFGARYSFGFSDLGKDLKWKNNGNLQITAGWLF